MARQCHRVAVQRSITLHATTKDERVEGSHGEESAHVASLRRRDCRWQALQEKPSIFESKYQIFTLATSTTWTQPCRFKRNKTGPNPRSPDASERRHNSFEQRRYRHDCRRSNDRSIDQQIWQTYKKACEVC